MPKDSKKRAAILNSMEVNWVAFYAKDVGKFWPVYILSYVLAIFLSLVSIVLLQKFTRTMVWFGFPSNNRLLNHIIFSAKRCIHVFIIKNISPSLITF